MAAEPTFFTRVGGEVCGPFDVANLRELVGLGHLLPTDDLSRDNGATWATAGRFKGLFPATEPVAVLAVPGAATAEPTYRFTQAGQSAGPLPVSSLRQLAADGALLRTDLVWADGDPTSTPAGQLPALAGAFASTAKPLAYHAPRPAVDAEPADFWPRFAAYVVDSVAIGLASAVLGGLLKLAVPGASSAPAAVADLLYRLIPYTIAWLYYAGFEASARRATPGKMAYGLIVTDVNGERLKFGRATARYAALYLSIPSLGISCLMAAWTERRQTLHDLLTKSLVVVRDAAAALPARPHQTRRTP